MPQTIILADDDSLFRAMMRKCLQALGFEVVENASGKNVLEQIRQLSPAACIIDLVMDEKEGIETIFEISALSHPPKVIAVSSNAQYLDAASALGADGILQKPVSPDALRQKLQEVGVLN